MNGSMIGRTTSALGHTSGNHRRALGCLLLLMIIYGATVPVVHSHSRVPPGHTDFVAISDADGSHSSRTGHPHQFECSVCRFQQQLFNGLSHAPVFALSHSAEFAFVPEPSFVYQATSTTPPSGRAPPVSLL